MHCHTDFQIHHFRYHYSFALRYPDFGLRVPIFAVHQHLTRRVYVRHGDPYFAYQPLLAGTRLVHPGPNHKSQNKYKEG